MYIMACSRYQIVITLVFVDLFVSNYYFLGSIIVYMEDPVDATSVKERDWYRKFVIAKFIGGT